MKKTRLIIGLIFLAVTIWICWMILRQWSENACDDSCLVIGCLWHITCSSALWFTVDQAISEYYNEKRRKEYYKRRILS